MNVIILPFRVDAPSAALQRFSAPELLHVYLSQCTSASSIQNMPLITLGKFATIKPVLLPDNPERTEYIVSYTRIKTVYRSTETGEESAVYSWQYKIWCQVKRSVSYLSSASISLPAETIVPLPSLLEQTTLYPAPRLHRMYLASTLKSQDVFDWMIDYENPTCPPILPQTIITQSSFAMLMGVLFAIRPVWTIDILHSIFQREAAFTLWFRNPVTEDLEHVVQYLNQLENISSDTFSVTAISSTEPGKICYRVALRSVTRIQCITATQKVAYTYINGPWRYVWIRRGLDVRFYPHLGLQAKSVDVRFRGELLEQLKSIIKTKSGSDYEAFLADLPQYLLVPFEAVFKPGPSLLRNYNRCICDLPQEMISWSGETLAETCTKQSGFCTQQYLDYVRSKLLNYINSLASEVVAIYRTVTGQVISNDNAKIETKFLELDHKDILSSELLDALQRDSVPRFDYTLIQSEQLKDKEEIITHSSFELNN